MICYTQEYREAGEEHSPVNLYEQASTELLEVGVMDKSAWVRRAVTLVQGTPRIEILAHAGELCVGGVVLAEDEDIHVGRCLTVMFNYVLPDYRNLGVTRHTFRRAMRVAEAGGYSTLAWTHRVGIGKYMTTYKELRWRKP